MPEEPNDPGVDAPLNIPDNVEVVAPEGLPRVDAGLQRPMALVAVVGLVVAVILGCVWAGIAISINRELGILAWLIGLAVGGAVAATAGTRNTQLGVLAVVMSIVGLATGKVLTAEIGLVSGVVDEILADPALVNNVVFRNLADAGEVDPEVLAWWETSTEADVPPEAIAPQYEAVQAQVQSIIANATEEEKRAWVEPFAQALVDQAPFADRYNLGGYDLLWAGLAIFSAWGVARGRET